MKLRRRSRSNDETMREIWCCKVIQTLMTLWLPYYITWIHLVFTSLIQKPRRRRGRMIRRKVSYCIVMVMIVITVWDEALSHSHRYTHSTQKSSLPNLYTLSHKSYCSRQSIPSRVHCTHTSLYIRYMHEAGRLFDTKKDTLAVLSAEQGQIILIFPDLTSICQSSE